MTRVHVSEESKRKDGDFIIYAYDYNKREAKNNFAHQLITEEELKEQIDSWNKIKLETQLKYSKDY